MVDSKFENLPGIVSKADICCSKTVDVHCYSHFSLHTFICIHPFPHDQAYGEPDVYETPDVPAEESPDFYDEPENECIERTHISTVDSYNKFRGKYLSGYVDFSDRISRRLRSGYDAQTNYDEMERETPLQKCQRLQVEMDELIRDIGDLYDDHSISVENKKCYEAIGTVANNAKKLLNNLRMEKVLGTEISVAATDAEVKKLLQQIDEYKKTGATVKLPAVDPSSELAYTKRIAELERKLHDIETTVGAEPEKFSRLSSTLHSDNLLDSVQKICTLAALLQPAQLDVIETRMNTLAGKMDSLNTSIESSDKTVDPKMLELYELAKRTEPVAQLLPGMLERMQALENLHSYGKTMIK